MLRDVRHWRELSSRTNQATLGDGDDKLERDGLTSDF